MSAMTAAALMAMCVLMPAPRSVELDTGEHFALTPGTPVVVQDGASQAWLEALSDALPGAGDRWPFVEASAHDVREPAVYVGEVGAHTSFESRKLRRETRGLDLPSQGYRAVVTKDRVVVAGADRAGAWYGFLSFCDLIEAPGVVPCGNWEDWPETVLRGVEMDARPSASELLGLARNRINLVLFRHPDLVALNGPAAGLWADVFGLARRYQIEPVPVLDVFNDAAPLVQRFPRCGEGRFVESRLPLDSRWQALEHSVVLDDLQSPLRVVVNGYKAELEKDYALIEGAAASPGNAAIPWFIRRTPGAAFPEGERVTVSYDYIPPGVRALCPTAAQTPQALEILFREVADDLKPSYVCVGPGPRQALAQDRRCRQSGLTPNELRARALSLVVEGLHRTMPEATPLVAMAAEDVRPLFSAFSGIGVIGGAADLDRLDTPMKVLLAPDRLGAYEATRAREQGESRIILGKTVAKNKVLTGRLWRPEAVRMPWPELLNEYYGAELWEPDYDAVRAAVTGYLNEATRQGCSLDELAKRSRDWEKRIKAEGLDGAQTVRVAGQLHSQMLDYLALERDYVQDRAEFPFRALVELVHEHCRIAPGAGEDRARRIEQIIRSKEVFVPSTILFGDYLLPSRAVELPPNADGAALPVDPVYEDRPHEAEATMDLGVCPGAIYRVDFETVGAARVEVLGSDDGVSFRLVESVDSGERGGVMPPVMIGQPFESRYARVRAIAPGEQAVLRSVALQALVQPEPGRCVFESEEPVVDGKFDEAVWSRAASVRAFTTVGDNGFARYRTEARLFWTADALCIGATMMEPRLETMRTDQLGHDMDLRDDESVEFHLLDVDGLEFRFAINAQGAWSESRESMAHWDGPWTVGIGRAPGAWTAEIRIPFDTLGVYPKGGERWPLRVTRNRCNITVERSAWRGVLTMAP